MDGRGIENCLHLIPVIVLVFLGGCISDNEGPSNYDARNFGTHDNSTHFRLADVGTHFIEFNSTNEYEYLFGNVSLSGGIAFAGPYDYRFSSNYTRYKLDIYDKNDTKRKITVIVTRLEEPADRPAIHTQDSLKELSFEDLPWRGSYSYKSQYSGNYEWLIRTGDSEDDFDAACWLDEKRILAISTFNFGYEDSQLIINSVEVSL